MKKLFKAIQIIFTATLFNNVAAYEKVAAVMGTELAAASYLNRNRSMILEEALSTALANTPTMKWQREFETVGQQEITRYLSFKTNNRLALIELERLQATGVISSFTIGYMDEHATFHIS